MFNRIVRGLNVLWVQLVFVALLGFGFGYVNYTAFLHAAGAQLCHTYTDPDTPLPNGYGSPFNLFSAARKAMITVTCDGTQAHISIGSGSSDQYIYKYAYERMGGSWKKIVLEGDTSAGPWFVGEANGTVARNAGQMGQTNRVVAYVCQRVNGSWKCGCRDQECARPYWQLQEFVDLTQLSDVFNTTEGMLFIAPPEPGVGVPGAMVTLSGGGFSRFGNTVYFDPHSEVLTNIEELPNDDFAIAGLEPSRNALAVDDTSSTDGRTMTVAVPVDAQPGGYRLFVENGDGDVVVGTEFRVTQPDLAAPRIISISPERVLYGSEVTITGSGFTAAGNDVITGLGIIRDVPSADGTTIRFMLEPFKDMLDFETYSALSDDNIQYPLILNVANEGGITDNTNQILLTFK